MKTTLFAAYKSARAEAMPHYHVTAKDALVHVKRKMKLDAWRKELNLGFYISDGDEYETPDGYTLRFKIEYDDTSRADDIEAQGYDVELNARRPDFADHGEFTRYSGEGMQACIGYGDHRFSYAVFDMPEDYIRQFYDNKNHSRHAAYKNMVASARLAIEQDIKNYLKTDYFYITLKVEAPDGAEIYSESIGGIDEDYASSGAAFIEYLYDGALEAVSEHKAKTRPYTVRENYSVGAFI